MKLINGGHQYLWHIFSYNKLDYIVEHKARDNFNDQIKTECYIFFRTMTIDS
ncbi:DUF4275 family protein [Fontibacillus panacisegetis]|uniref:DUF4275 family protein n=1 Tax=Fontibacillus panacisegetis TaxID=670482 RepID=UPI000B847467